MVLLLFLNEWSMAILPKVVESRERASGTVPVRASVAWLASTTLTFMT